MKAIKSKKEFKLMKDEISKKLDDFIESYDIFIKSVSPNYWRTTGNNYRDLISIKKEISRFEPLKMSHLDSEIVRDEVLTDEEKELYITTKKYNI